MVEQRLFHREILQSSLYYQLGESFPGKELHAQRIFETLILMADDYGRGRFIPADLRSRAFSSARTAFSEVSLNEIEQWMGIIEKNGSAYRYKIKEEVYYFLPKWFEYQSLKYRKNSHIPPPSPQVLANLDLFLANTGEILPIESKNGDMLDNSDIRKEKKRKEKKSKEEKETKSHSSNSKEFEDFPEHYRNLVIELFPHMKAKFPELRKQVKALDGLIRLDYKHIGTCMSKAAWEREVFAVLRWMRSDDQPHGDFPGWSAVFRSIPRLRNNACEKFLNAQAAFHRAVEFTPELPPEPDRESEDDFLKQWEAKTKNVE